MTPERLSSRLRSDPGGLLSEFGMFVIDEAHLVADRERGWRLEETLSLLHHLTKTSHHRILVLSAALGNQAHVTAWLDSGNGVLSRHVDWRGPRRLAVVYTARADGSSVSDQPPSGNTLARRFIPLKGLVHLRTGLSGSFRRGEFSESVGTLVMRQQKNGVWVRDSSRSTTQHGQLLPLITHVQSSGSVLIVVSTKGSAQRLAERIANSMEDDPTSFALTDLVRTRLGSEHPLTRVIAKGVAFHHAALPIDVQSEIEEAVRIGQINCLVATTTLTEGVNLPFKSVIVAERGYRDSEGVVEVVDSARLLNAIGRAGRAGRETEGWLILVEHATFNRSMFRPLDQTARDLDMRSTMTSEEALAQLARLEESARAQEDAIFAHFGSEANGFVRSVWLIAQALAELGRSATLDDVLEALTSTLAWQQLDENSRVQWREIVTRAFRAFSVLPVDRRRRWTQSGMSLPSAATLEEITLEVLNSITSDIAESEPPLAISMILGEGRLEKVLHLSENRRMGFKEIRNAPRDSLLPVDLMMLLIDWVSGTDLQDLADKYLASVQNEDYRYEQLVEFVASVFEHHLPWALNTLVDWVNENLEKEAIPYSIPNDLAASVHYGVATRSALNLMLGGVRSRRLANRVAEDHRAAGSEFADMSLREWVASQSIAAWREKFDASPTEIADLLAFARDPSLRLVNEVLEGEEYTIAYDERVPVYEEATARLTYEPNQLAPAPIAVYVNGEIVGTVGPDHHDDVLSLLAIGIPLDIRVLPSWSGPSVVLRLASESDT